MKFSAVLVQVSVISLGNVSKFRQGMEWKSYLPLVLKINEGVLGKGKFDMFFIPI